jgi:predicted DNA-binding ribbon-helix-helix protein
VKRRTNVSIDEEIYDQLKAYADKHGISFSQLVTEAALDYVQDNEKDRARICLERFAEKLGKVLRQQDMQEAAKVADIVLLNFLDDLPRIIDELRGGGR